MRRHVKKTRNKSDFPKRGENFGNEKTKPETLISKKHRAVAGAMGTDA
ncbi:MAG: hypothetical protein JNK09_19880 [Prolixibacteraceae bacterium]|nr:hypothetical protein [Prolixibacteraceae bacterium]